MKQRRHSNAGHHTGQPTAPRCAIDKNLGRSLSYRRHQAAASTIRYNQGTIMSAFSVEQIGVSPVRFPSGAPIPSMTDAATDPYVRTRVPKETQVEGLQFWPQEKAVYPGIVLLHDRWGLNSQVQEVAVRLATEGYTVLVPNLYVRQGGVVTGNAEVAEALRGRINPKDLLQDINSCCEFMNTRDHVKRNVHGVIGFGMGADLAIMFAGQRKRLRAAVVFYGVTPLPQSVKDLYCPLLYLRPEKEDEATALLRQAATEHNKTLVVKSYEGARPGFFDSTRKDSFDAHAAQDAWTMTVQFFNDYLKSAR
jgi:carboxymethylenebutenolidase